MFDSFVSFVVMMNFRKYYFVIMFFIGLSSNANSQHYFLIESKSLQPFYLKLADTIYSSSGEGFMIVPQNMEKKLSCTIGFPKNKYPEIRFELDSMDRDRGFYLKQFAGKGWGLFDRTNMEVIFGMFSGLVESSAGSGLPKAGENEFATMLSEVTGDVTILERLILPPNVKAADILDKKVFEKNKTIAIIKVVKEVIEKPSTISAIKELVVDTLNNGRLQMRYLDSVGQGVMDTIMLQIDLNQDFEKKSPKLDSPIILPNSCLLTAANKSDLEGIQRKLLGFKDGKDQLNYLKKAYSNKCFTTNQTQEISWFLSNESVRLGFYELAIPLLSDRHYIMKLQEGLMEEENVKAFKELVLRNASQQRHNQ